LAVSPQSDRLVAFTLRVMLHLGSLLAAFLLVSGVVLALGGYQAADPDGFWPLSHRWAANGLTLVAVLSIPFGLSLSMFRLKLAPVAVSTGSILFAIALGLTGSGLAFRQVALAAVTTGDSERSFLGWLFAPGVRFFIVGSAEVSPTQMRVYALLHLVVLPIVLAAVGGVLGRYLRPPKRVRSKTADQPNMKAEPISRATPAAPLTPTNQPDPNEPTWL